LALGFPTDQFLWAGCGKVSGSASAGPFSLSAHPEVMIISSDAGIFPGYGWTKY
jgi:hypothetical protein